MSQRNREEEAKLAAVAWWLWLALVGAVAAAWLWALLHAGFNVG